MLTGSDIQQMGNLPAADRQKLPLAPGDDVPESSWRNLFNLRLEVDGQYVFWKARGGSELVNSFDDDILTAEAFQARKAGLLGTYIGVHTAAGDVYVWDVEAQSSTQIAAGAFSTTGQIQFASNGRFLYMFDYDGGAAKYYDFTSDTTRDFLSYNNAYITGHNWLAEGMENPNIWGFEPGAQIIVYPNGVPTTGVQIYASDGSSANSIKPSRHRANSFLYNYTAGGDFLKTLDGTEYKATQFITFDAEDGPLDFTVESGDGTPFTIDEHYIPLDDAGNPSFISYVTTIDDIKGAEVSFTDPAGVPQTAILGGLSSFADENVVLPYNVDLEDLVGAPSNKRLSADGSAVESNPDYTFPNIYRQYVVFEMLEDGSMTLMGRPLQVKANPTTIHGDGATRLSLTITSAGGNVTKRFLATTRWQASPSRAFRPTSPEYSNSPLFIVGEVDSNRVFAKDYTPDDEMFRPLNERQPITAGVSDLFGSGQLAINSIAQFTGSLLAGGYTIHRPVPAPYLQPTMATDENIYVDISPTTQLPNNIALAFQFEYTDGRRSGIVETEQFLQEGVVVESETTVCGQVKATATHEVTGAATSDGDVEITYDGESVVIPLTTADHNTTFAVADAIAQGVNDSPDLRIEANVPRGAEIVYTERRYGETFNGNTVTVTLAGGGGDPGITFDTQSPTLADGEDPEGEPAEMFITPITNALDPGSSVPVHYSRDGVDSDSNPVQISSSDSLQDIANKISGLTANVPDTGWNGVVEQRPSDGKWRDRRTRNDPGDTSWNGTPFSIETLIESTTSYIELELGNPRGATSRVDNETESASLEADGAVEPCDPAEGEIFISGNNLSGSSEDHVITIDGISTDPITIPETHTLEDIADDYIAAIQAVRALDVITTAAKTSVGGGWTVDLTWRQFGEVGNGKEVEVSGDVDVDVSTINYSGGDNGETVATSTSQTVSANRVQIHSLNQLVSKVYILGRTTDGATEFHPIDDVEITDPGAHGMVLELPNTEAELDDIEGSIHAQPTAAQVLEMIDLENYMVIGTPFQQFQISTQEPITDQSAIRRVMPVDFAADTTVMRYRVMIFTDRNIQIGYLADQTQTGQDRTTRVFESDFEIAFAGMKSTAREGISDVFGHIIFPTRDGMYSWPRSGSPQYLFDVRRYSVSSEETLKDVVYNQDHGEFWFIYPASEVIVYQLRSDSARRMDYSGISTLGCGAFFNDKLYIGSGPGLMATDEDSLTADDGASITARAETTHIGNELTQMRLLEVTVGGQEFDCKLDVDLQPERFESAATTWGDSFNADKQLGPKELVMSGASYQVQAMAVMPRLRVSFDAVAGSRLAYVILKSVATDNRGRARV